MKYTNKYGKSYDVIIEKANYSNHRTSLLLINKLTGEPIIIATVNLIDEPLEKDEVFIKDWSENEGVLKFLQDNKYVGEVITNVSVGYVFAQKCKLLI